MPRNGSGQYNLPYNWNDDKANGIKVLASRMQGQDQDIATALTGSLASDGQTPLTGDLDFNNNKAVDLADGASLGDAINVSQAQTGETQFYGISTTTPAGTDGEDYDVAAFATILAYTSYIKFSFICHFTCIANPNLRIDGLAAKTLKKSDGAGGFVNLETGDLVADNEYQCVYNEDVNSTDIIILNPEIPYINQKHLLPIGIIIGWDNAVSIPDNFLSLDGSAVLITDIPLLAPVIYCGDANNATASYYYKFTNPADPNASRSTAGTYILLKDTSGRFARGWKSGQTIDSGRAFNSYQDHAAQLHRHSQSEGQIIETPNNVYVVTGKTINGVTYGTTNAVSPTQVNGYSSSVQLPSTTSGTVNVASENRPTNYTEISIIKYQ